MESMTSLQRVAAALAHREPDRVPFFLLLTMHGARELGLGIRQYFSKPEYVAEGQLRMRQRYRHDCLYSFFHAAQEMVAWGGEVIFREDGPPNAAPLLKGIDKIRDLHPPRIQDSPALQQVLAAIGIMKQSCGGEVPIIGVSISPFSLPVMQLGFESYLRVIYEEPALFQRLMAVNSEFCVNWSNAQLAAGASVICYFDPVSSPTIVPPDLYRGAALAVTRQVLSRIKGPVAIHMASGRCLPIVDDLTTTGTVALGVSALEELGALKAACRDKVTVLGNLDGVDMVNWTADLAAAKVREALAKAGPGGGFILSDNHGEIPLQVSSEVLSTISESVHSFGRYPLCLE